MLLKQSSDDSEIKTLLAEPSALPISFLPFLRSQATRGGVKIRCYFSCTSDSRDKLFALT